MLYTWNSQNIEGQLSLKNNSKKKWRKDFLIGTAIPPNCSLSVTWPLGWCDLGPSLGTLSPLGLFAASAAAVVLTV